MATRITTKRPVEDLMAEVTAKKLQKLKHMEPGTVDGINQATLQLGGVSVLPFRPPRNVPPLKSLRPRRNSTNTF